MVRTEGRAFAFEPDPSNFALLRRNVGLNSIGKVVSPRQMALGNHPDVRGIVFYTPFLGEIPESSLVAKSFDMLGVMVPLETLDGLCERNGLRPELIKIDTEAAEWPIIERGLRLIRATKP